ncbi:hypothetical protein [Flectobacillus major]|uniref:hypothetical protein n=1 Tax=Flectobacillus major TaxID=103 RepID=UPI000405A0BD|nr:hypothetical protein [Flectobacillus major]
MDKNNLYVFVTSNSPDVYINAILHCKTNFKLEREIYFIGIFEDNGKREDAEKYLDDVKGEIISQIRNLSRGEYFSSKDKSLKKIEIPEHHQRKYASLLDFKFVYRAVLYKNLENELKQIITKQSIFDVTGFQKDYLIDVYTLSFFLNNSSLFYFKIKKLKHRTYDDKELIHNLQVNTEYEYENISKSAVTVGTSVFKNEVFEIENKKDLQIISIIEGWASSHANIITNIVRTIIIIPLVAFVLLFLKNLNSWNEIEPWTFLLLAPAIWILNLIFQIFSGKNMEEALKIDNLYDWLKTNKLKKIKNDIEKS